MFQPNPEDHLHLRLHRARSVVLTSDELVEIRAAQRTFEGAYMRTALGQFSFALIILKVFTAEFYAIGALFAVYGAAVMLVAMYRRYEGNRQFFTSPAPCPHHHHHPPPPRQQQQQQPRQEYRQEQNGDDEDDYEPRPPCDLCRAFGAPEPVRKFRTSGNSVALLAAFSLSAYIVLLVLTWQLTHDPSS
ncbi:hypothetical protein SODALDRAFT_210613 [Sodiomyces alkalinus F11]|uniref:DUF202 domain-containing protein n=1 Tax=Sodiomyces alkalinus (strain CBS 110278 / VKM F-3762 / F11) TaxID=1314773 RepID=A0A3N2PQY5_SODAK|nr:hypothetical protein SODALDRAFT_210613 [Sodiomyces alkalinus F11]ROT36923.1 hypothetical protein SODALDRAFT_210613 [Sodiomyces alkalinus F11]